MRRFVGMISVLLVIAGSTVSTGSPQLVPSVFPGLTSTAGRVQGLERMALTSTQYFGTVTKSRADWFAATFVYFEKPGVPSQSLGAHQVPNWSGFVRKGGTVFTAKTRRTPRILPSRIFSRRARIFG